MLNYNEIVRGELTRLLETSKSLGEYFHEDTFLTSGFNAFSINFLYDTAKVN